jgi:hypothetical protein
LSKCGEPVVEAPMQVPQLHLEVAVVAAVDSFKA